MTQKCETQADALVARQRAEYANIFSRLPATYAASRTQAQRILQEAGGLSVVEWRVLWDLAEAGPLSIRDLARLQRADHSLLSRALPDMKRKGFVTTEKDPTDGRQIVVTIAPAGRSAYTRAAPVMQRRRQALRAALSEEEILQFVGYLDRLEAFMKQPASVFLEDENA